MSTLPETSGKTELSIEEINAYHREGGMELLSKVAQQVIWDFSEEERIADIESMEG